MMSSLDTRNLMALMQGQREYWENPAVIHCIFCQYQFKEQNKEWQARASLGLNKTPTSLFKHSDFSQASQNVLELLYFICVMFPLMVH